MAIDIPADSLALALLHHRLFGNFCVSLFRIPQNRFGVCEVERKGSNDYHPTRVVSTLTENPGWIALTLPPAR